MPLRLCGFVLAGLLALLSPLQARPLYIVAIGASNTSGLGVGEQNAYPAVLERLLRQKGIDAHVTNAGVWGDVTAGMRNRLDSVVLKEPTSSFCSRALMTCASSARKRRALRISRP